MRLLDLLLLELLILPLLLQFHVLVALNGRQVLLSQLLLRSSLVVNSERCELVLCLGHALYRTRILLVIDLQTGVSRSDQTRIDGFHRQVPLRDAIWYR